MTTYMIMRTWLSYSGLLLLALALAPFVSSKAVGEEQDNLTELWFGTNLDHFSFRNTEQTFPLRYFVTRRYWDEGNGTGPCFFYAGNEADITVFIKNSGFMFEAAQELGALVVFAEHRYYGQSFPFGGAEAALTPEKIHFLTVEQAMADFMMLNLHIRKQFSMPKTTAVIAFGGSYGGNLAMWLRLKSPHLWAGAIASSATPLKHLLRESNCFNRIVAEVYSNVSTACPDLIRAGWKSLYKEAKSSKGRANIAAQLGLCEPLPNAASANMIHGFVSDALETMVQYGYPYPTSFFNPVPAYPFRAACHRMIKAGTGLGALSAAMQVYYNYTGDAGKCFDFEQDIKLLASKNFIKKGRAMRMPNLFPSLQDATDTAWGYQTCTEAYQPMPTNGVTDFEVPYTPNQTAYFERCQQKWGVVPRPNWEEQTFGGTDIGTGSNIFLASCQLDPWRAAGIQSTPSGADPDSIVVRIIEGGAHHFDLRGSNPLYDPPSVVKVRREEIDAIQKWTLEWKRVHGPLSLYRDDVEGSSTR